MGLDECNSENGGVGNWVGGGILATGTVDASLACARLIADSTSARGAALVALST